MNDRSNRPTSDEQPVTGVKDERSQHRPRGSRGLDGPIDGRAGYKTHYGETAYGGGQKRYGGQPPVEGVSQGDAGRTEGKAGSKATVPGAGADRGPSESR